MHRSTNPQQARPLVVKVGGALLDEPERHGATFDGLVQLHRQRGIVLVHGGGLLVDRHLARLGIETKRIDGIRLSPPEVVEELAGVLAGRVNTRLVGLLNARGASAVGLSLADARLCNVRRATHFAFDAGAVGEVVGGDPAILHTLLEAGHLPTVCSVGVDGDGGFLNVNADDAAVALAGIAGASGLVLLTDVAGVLDRDGTVIPTLDRSSIDRLIKNGTISGGMTVKVRGALVAAESAGVPVTIASWSDPDSLRLSPQRSTRVVPTAAPASASDEDSGAGTRAPRPAPVASR